MATTTTTVMMMMITMRMRMSENNDDECGDSEDVILSDLSIRVLKFQFFSWLVEF